jgi:hypothetical protein
LSSFSFETCEKNILFHIILLSSSLKAFINHTQNILSAECWILPFSWHRFRSCSRPFSYISQPIRPSCPPYVVAFCCCSPNLFRAGGWKSILSVIIDGEIWQRGDDGVQYFNTFEIAHKYFSTNENIFANFAYFPPSTMRLRLHTLTRTKSLARHLYLCSVKAVVII